MASVHNCRNEAWKCYQDIQERGIEHYLSTPLVLASVVDLPDNLIVELVLIVFFLLFAGLAGAVGIGGGALFTPLLLIIGGLTVSQAIPIASATIVGVGLASTFVNAQEKTINYGLAITLEPFTIIGTIIGVQIFLYVPEDLILFLFVILMVLLSFRTSFNAYELKKKANPLNENLIDMENSNLTLKKTEFAIIGSLVAGMISSIVGIGGGLIKVPMLSELGLSPRIASGTGSFMVLFTSLSAALQFIIFSRLEPLLGIVFFSMGFLGSLLGTYISRKSGQSYSLQLLLTLTIILSTIFIVGESLLGLLI
ncbi:MAG: sulfite exporter TauE/SafE family protein [Candidatus Heimdallarchaeota archaeon]